MFSFLSIPTRDARPLVSALASGLALDPVPGLSFRAEVDGAPIEVTAHIDLAHSSGKHRRRRPHADVQHLAVRLPLQPPQSELSIRAVGARQWQVSTKDPSRAAAFGTGSVLQAMSAASLRTPPTVAGGAVRWNVAERLPWSEADAFLPTIRALPRVWHAVQAAARGAPPSPGTEEVLVRMLDVVEPGLELWGAPSGLVGRIGRCRIMVSVVTNGDGWDVWAWIDLPDPLAGRPRVVRESSRGVLDAAADWLAIRRERELDDPAFDARFAVRGVHRTDLALFTPAVRDAMLSLDRRIPLTLVAPGVRCSGASRSIDDILDIARATLALARALDEAA